MIRVRIMTLLAVTLAWATLPSPMTARADPGRTQADYTYLTTLHLKLGVQIGDSEADYDRVTRKVMGYVKTYRTPETQRAKRKSSSTTSSRKSRAIKPSGGCTPHRWRTARGWRERASA
jgi:hypothetical protein